MTQERVLRNLYVFHRRSAEERLGGRPSLIGSSPIPSWDGGEDRHGRRHKPVWPKLARLLDSAGYDPALYVEAQFASDKYPCPPEPNVLLSEQAALEYRDYDDNGAARARTQLAAQKTQFLLETRKAQMLFDLAEGEAARQVLADPTVSLSALFRCCMASCGGADDVAARYRAAALQHLVVRFHSLTPGWDAFLPDALVDTAAELIASLCAETAEGRRA